jgi:hypothetical protein
MSVIATTLRSAAADVELRKVEDLGRLVMAVFDRIARVDGDLTGLFAADALAEYAAIVGAMWRPTKCIASPKELRDANVIMRRKTSRPSGAGRPETQGWR